MARAGKGHVVGLGAPIMDLILRVSDDFLDSIPGKRGGVELIEYAKMQQLIRESGEVPVTCPGGSASNMLRGLAQFGHACTIIGKQGRDEMGKEYAASMDQMGVDAYLYEANTPTTLALSMVDPSGLHTMRAFMGASQELTPDEIDPDSFQGASHLHIEGYAFYNPASALRAIELAKSVGATISLDLANFEVVGRFYDQMVATLQESVDLVFASGLEAKAITGKTGEEGCDLLAKWCPLAVVMMGKEGGFVSGKGERFRYKTDVIEEPIDTTGAGALFASGFISGLLEGRYLDACAKKGALAGSAVVQVLGAVIPQSLWPPLLAQMP